jgi:hypothetical protein
MGRGYNGCTSCGGSGATNGRGKNGCTNCGGSGSTAGRGKNGCTYCGGSGATNGRGWYGCDFCGGSGPNSSGTTYGSGHRGGCTGCGGTSGVNGTIGRGKNGCTNCGGNGGTTQGQGWKGCTTCGGTAGGNNVTPTIGRGKNGCTGCGGNGGTTNGQGWKGCTQCGGTAGGNNVTPTTGSGKISCAICSGKGQIPFIDPDAEGVLHNGQSHSCPITDVSPVRSGTVGGQFCALWEQSGRPQATAWPYQSCGEYLFTSSANKFKSYINIWDSGGKNFGCHDPIYPKNNLSRRYSRICTDSEGCAHVLFHYAYAESNSRWYENEFRFVYLKFNASGTSPLIEENISTAVAVENRSYYLLQVCDRDLALVSSPEGQTVPVALVVQNSASIFPEWAGYDVVLISRIGKNNWVIADKSNVLRNVPEVYEIESSDSRYPATAISWSFRLQPYNRYLFFAVCKPPYLSLTYSPFSFQSDGAVKLGTQVSFPNLIPDCGRIVSMDICGTHLWITYMSGNFTQFKYAYIPIPTLMK